MICDDYTRHRQAHREDFCTACLWNKLDNVEKMLKILMLQMNNVEEQVVPKIEEDTHMCTVLI